MPPKSPRGPHLYTRELSTGTWYYAYLGRDDRRALNTQDPKEANRRFAEELLRDRPASGAGAPAEEALLVDLARDWCDAPHGWTARTEHSCRLRIAAFLEAVAALGATRPSDLTLAVLDAWRAERAKRVSRATINRDETVARRLLAWAVARSLATSNPFEGRDAVREPSRPRRRVIHSPTQIARAVAWASEQGLRGWVLTAATLEITGLRIDEVRRLDESWLTPKGLRLVPDAGAANAAWTSKGYRPREIELAPESLDTVKEFIAWKLKGKGATGKTVGVSERWFGKVADRATHAVKLPGTYRPHDARRRWVTELVRAGTPISVVRDLVGHADVQTTERYVCAYYDDAKAVSTPTPALITMLKERERNAR